MGHDAEVQVELWPPIGDPFNLNLKRKLIENE